MPNPSENARFVYEFGKFMLDPRERVLVADGRRIHLTDKVFDTLLLLIENSGQLMTKDEMMSALWEESFVEESNLTKNISRLRKILNIEGNELIETLPKRGYRFIGEVRRIEGGTSLTVRRDFRLKVTHTIEDQAGDEFSTAAGTAIEVPYQQTDQIPATRPLLIGQRSSRKPLFIALAFVIVIGVTLAYFLWPRRKPIGDSLESGIVRLTNNSTDEDAPQWTADNQIRFIRFASSGKAESFVMNADGTNQHRANTEIKILRTGEWSPDGKKVIFSKEGEDPKNVYLADADGGHEIKFPFAFGNHDWSPDSSRFVYQAIDPNDKSNSELYIYTLATGKSVNITSNAAFDADPSFSPDGKQVVFASTRDGNQKIYLMNVDGSAVRRLSEGSGRDSFPAFAPDGTQIAFESTRENENADLYLLNVNDQSAPVKLTHWPSNEEIRRGCWSPDGTRIVFTSDRSDKSNIYVIDIDVPKAKSWLADPEADLQSPSFSPDGKQFVYQARLPDKTGELRIYDLQSNTSRLLLKTENFDLSPAWSPDGSLIVFTNRIAGNTEVCTVKPDGAELKNLTSNPARDTSPVWSPDGKGIVFASDRGGQSQFSALFRMNADGSNPERVLQKEGYEATPAFSPTGGIMAFAADRVDGKSQAMDIYVLSLADMIETTVASRRLHDSLPSFSPDGKRLAFVSQSDGNQEIYLVNADGTGLVRLTRNTADDTTPKWSGNDHLVFSSNRNGRFALYEIEIPKRPSIDEH